MNTRWDLIDITLTIVVAIVSMVLSGSGGLGRVNMQAT